MKEEGEKEGGQGKSISFVVISWLVYLSSKLVNGLSRKQEGDRHILSLCSGIWNPSLPGSQYKRQEQDDILQSSGIIGAEKQALVERFLCLYCISELETYLSYLAVPCILLPRKPKLPPASPPPSALLIPPTPPSLLTMPGLPTPSSFSSISSSAHHFQLLFCFISTRSSVFSIFHNFSLPSHPSSSLPTLQSFLVSSVTLPPLPQGSYVSLHLVHLLQLFCFISFKSAITSVFPNFSFFCLCQKLQLIYLLQFLSLFCWSLPATQFPSPLVL